MDAKKLIEDLESEVEREKAAVAVKEKLLAEWKLKMGINAPDKDKESQAQGIHKRGVIDVDDLFEEQPKKQTIVGEVKEIVERFGAKEFTVQHVDKVYKMQHGIPDEDISNRTRISTALGKLKDSGFVDVAFKGGGNVPHKYVVAKHDIDEKG
ncbi:MAG: hypothetical protein WAW41_12085 [Methylobacter sp.]